MNLTDTKSFNDAAKSDRLVTVTGKANVSKIWGKKIEIDGRYTICNIVNGDFIMKCILKVRTISAR